MNSSRFLHNKFINSKQFPERMKYNDVDDQLKTKLNEVFFNALNGLTTG